MYILNVHYEESGAIWENFENFIGGSPDPNSDDVDDARSSNEYDDRKNKWIDAALVDYNAVDIRDSTLIQFETEEDATAFILRFG